MIHILVQVHKKLKCHRKRISYWRNHFNSTILYYIGIACVAFAHYRGDNDYINIINNCFVSMISGYGYGCNGLFKICFGHISNYKLQLANARR